jgi:competence protein ComEA
MRTTSRLVTGLGLIGLSCLFTQVLAGPPTRPATIECAPAMLVGDRLVCGESGVSAVRTLCRGALPNADRVHLRGGEAVALGDGCRLGRMPGAEQLALGGTLELNTASTSELESLPGIGPTLAQRIVEQRPFASVDELLRVPGIGAGRLSAVRRHVRAEFPGPPRREP